MRIAELTSIQKPSREEVRQVVSCKETQVLSQSPRLERSQFAQTRKILQFATPVLVIDFLIRTAQVPRNRGPAQGTRGFSTR